MPPRRISGTSRPPEPTGQTPPVLASAGLPARRLTTHPVGGPFDAVDPGCAGRDTGVSVNLSPVPTLTQCRAPGADPEQRNGRFAGNRLNLGGPMDLLLLIPDLLGLLASSQGETGGRVTGQDLPVNAPHWTARREAIARRDALPAHAISAMKTPTSRPTRGPSRPAPPPPGNATIECEVPDTTMWCATIQTTPLDQNNPAEPRKIIKAMAPMMKSRNSSSSLLCVVRGILMRPPRVVEPEPRCRLGWRWIRSRHRLRAKRSRSCRGQPGRPLGIHRRPPSRHLPGQPGSGHQAQDGGGSSWTLRRTRRTHRLSGQTTKENRRPRRRS